MNARRLDNGVHTGGYYYWKANPGYVFVELEVKASNLQTGLTVSLPWNDIYVAEPNNDEKKFPAWGGSKPVESGGIFSPSNLSVGDINNGTANLSFKAIPSPKLN